MSITAAVLTVSDGVFHGTRKDESGKAVAEYLKTHGFTVGAPEVVADEQPAIQAALIALCGVARFVVTTGGTGISPRDVTPEATLAVCDRVIPGIAEWMRAEGMKHTQFSALSRAVCGSRGESLIVNLPGSPQGARQSLEVVMPLVRHAIDLLAGKTQH